MRQVQIDTLTVHDVTFAEAVATIVTWAREGAGGYVCTPNVDHVVRARRDPEFRRLVMEARLRVPDGMGIVYGSRVSGEPLRGTVTGRLLPMAIAQTSGDDPPPMALVGGRPGAAREAAERLKAAGAHVVEAIEPPMGFEVGSALDAGVVEALRRSGARVVFAGFGAPKQERWMAAHAGQLGSATLVGIGQGIDVLGGRARPAPEWMTNVGVEWAFRLVQEPTRMVRRYLWDDPRFFWWMWRARRRRAGRPVN